MNFALECFKDVATKDFSGYVAEGVTEQATFAMFPNEQLLFAVRPKVGRSQRTLHLDVDHVNKENLSMSSVFIGDQGD